MSSKESRGTVALTIVGVAILLAIGIALSAIDFIQAGDPSQVILPQGVLEAMSVTSVLVGIVMIVLGFRQLRSLPVSSAVLVVGGSVIAALPWWWLLLPPILAVALSVVAVRRAFRVVRAGSFA